MIRALLFLALLLGPGTLAAETCTREQIAGQVETGSQALRRINGEAEKAINQRLIDLQKQKGWDDHELEERAYGYVEDDRIRTLDGETNALVTRMEALADDASQVPPCERLLELRQTFDRLSEIARTKNGYMLAKLDRELAKGSAGPAAGASAAPAAPKPAPTAKTEPRPPAAVATVPPSRMEPPPAASSPPPAAVPSAPGLEPSRGAWSPTTLPSTEEAHDTYTLEEIRNVGRGFFGRISNGLVSVLDYAFQKAGRPTGYILGDEGGGAFLAGVRYGKGTLHIKGAEPQVVYWRGPSIGYDFGAAGSRLMVLVYNVRTPAELYASFGGIDGSAYLVGGVGITFLTNGQKVMAPIRSGLGLRLGANVGYLKFAPKASWLPF